MEQQNLDIYGNDALPWSRVLEHLESPPSPVLTYWLATVGPDGRPHSAGVGALWEDGKLYFVSGAGTRKSRNLGTNPRCAISVSMPGIDLVLEGTARKVTDQPTLARLAERYAAQGWPASVDDAALTASFSAPSAGRPPWDLHVLTLATAFGVASAEPYGATRWRFD